MNNQQAVVDQIVQNLAFDVEAVPKNELNKTSISQSTPLNVKIKVRKKDEIHIQNDIISMDDNTSRTKQKIRLVNSDRTIMTFDVFMEAEFEKKPEKKLRKHIFDMLRPGICLGAVDDDEYPYMPSSSYSANITEPSVATKSDGTLKQTFTLTKNVYQDYSVSTQPEGQKWLFGKCKPGGCLDPPFGEDKYSYKPSTRSGPEREEKELLKVEDVGTAVDSNKKPITLHDEETQSNGRHSSMFDSGLFKKKRKSSDKSTSTKIPDKTDSIVESIYQKDSATTSTSIHSNPIITYPPKIKTEPRTSDDKTARSKGPSEEKSRKSFNDHSEPYFVPPKGVQRIRENSLDPNDQPKHRPSDVADVKKLLTANKTPVPLLIPIPVPIPTNYRKPTPEVIVTNDDILKKDSIPDHELQNQELLEQELQDQKPQDTKKIKDTELSPLHITPITRTKSANEDTYDKPEESSKKESLVPSNVKQPTPSNEIDDQNLNGINLEPLEAKENNIEDTAQQNKLKKTEYFKIPVPIPVPLPFNLSDSNRDDGADSFFEGSKDMQQSTDLGLGENESVAKTIPNLEYTNIEGDELPEKYLRTRGGFSEKESDTEIPATLSSIIDKDIKQDLYEENNPERIQDTEKQSNIIDNTTIPTKYIQEDVNPDLESQFGSEVITDGIEKPTEQKGTNEDIKRDFKGIETPKEQQEGIKALAEEDIKRVSKDETITDGMEILAKYDDIQNVILASETRDSEGEKIVDRIEKSKEQKDIEDKVIVSTKYVGDSADGKDEQRSSLASEPEYETDARDSEMSKPHRDIEYETIKPNKDDNIDSFTGDETRYSRKNEGAIDIIAAPVLIDNNTEPTSVFEPVTEVYRGTNLSSDVPITIQIDSRFKKFDDEEDDLQTTVSQEEIGTKSVVYESVESVPSTSTKKQALRTPSSDKRVILVGDTVLSSIQSICTLKSAMKRGTISIDLGFHSYLNINNERIVKTFDSAKAPKRLPSDSVTIIKSQVRLSSNEIRIPVDSEHDMSIQIKKANANQRVSISESRLVNVIDTGKAKKQRSSAQYSDIKTRIAEVKTEGRKDIYNSDSPADRFLNYYEKELVPLQLTIKNLRDEIDCLATQQSMFRDKLYCPNKSKLPRLVHSSKKCFGCIKK